MADREDWLALATKKKAEQRAEILNQVLHSSVKLEALTGDPNWDHYLSMVQGLIESAEKERAPLERSLADSDILDHAELLKIKFNIARCTASIQSLQVAIGLPKKIIENAKQLGKAG